MNTVQDIDRDLTKALRVRMVAVDRIAQLFQDINELDRTIDTLLSLRIQASRDARGGESH